MTKRIFLLCWSFALVFTIIIGKLAFVQLANGPVYAAQSFNNRSERFPLETHFRGQFYDRNHEALLNAESTPALVIFPQLLADPYTLYQQLSQNYPQLSIAKEQIVPVLSEGKTIFPKTFAVMIPNEALLHDLIPLQQKGFVIAPYYNRYTQKNLAIHLLGYLDSDGNGVKGLEKRCNRYLKGNHAQIYLAYLTDARNNLLEGASARLVTNPDARNDVVLTLDKTLQKTLEDLLDQSYITKGGAVLLDTKSGQILAAASRPVYNPEDVMESYGYTDNQLERVMGDDYCYYPGSIFKLLTALGALEENIADETTKFTCDNLPPHNKCPRPHGQLDFAGALKVSCNNYFIALGEQLGQDKLTEYIIRRGNFQLEEDKALDSKAARANGVIGQELFKVSPLEMANLMVTIANDGKAFSLENPWENRLILAIEHKGQSIQQSDPLETKQIFSPASVRTLQKMLQNDFVTDSGQTISYIGKTGTPEIYQKGQKGYLAWYIGYAPADNPQYALAVVIEAIAGVPQEDLAGGKYALPFFKNLMAKILPSS